MMKKIDLNCDIGEGYGPYTIGNDEDIIKLVSSVNIACGFHGGDPDVMDKTVQLAKKYNVRIGAHPGYPNLLGFGRWDMDIPRKTLTNIITYQIGALDIFCKKHGVNMQHMKPHGNLNNQADHDETIARAIVEAVQAIDTSLPILVKPNSQLEKVAISKGQPIILELFADRAYKKNLTLVSRHEKGAVITDVEDVVQHVVRIVKEGKIIAITGEEIDVDGQSICVHGDTVTALNMVKAIRTALERENIALSL